MKKFLMFLFLLVPTFVFAYSQHTIIRHDKDGNVYPVYSAFQDIRLVGNDGFYKINPLTCVFSTLYDSETLFLIRTQDTCAGEQSTSRKKSFRCTLKKPIFKARFDYSQAAIRITNLGCNLALDGKKCATAKKHYKDSLIIHCY
jgi:hypothetical protein